MDKYELELLNKADALWQKSIALSDNFITKGELSRLSDCSVEEIDEKVASAFTMGIFRLSRLAYNPEEGIIDKLVNVYSSLHSLGASVFIIVHGDADGNTEFYLGCRSRSNADAARSMLKRSLVGNFPGIELEEFNSDSKNEVLDRYFPLTYQRQSVASLSVSADFRKNRTEQNSNYIQGIEKFIDSMKGQSYTMLILAEPLSKTDCIDKRVSLENLITELSKYHKVTLAYTENSSVGVTESLAEGVSKTVSDSINHSVSTNTSISVGKNRGRNSGRSGPSFFGATHSTGSNYGTSKTKTKGTSESDSSGQSTSEGTSSNKSKGTSKTDTSGTSVTLNVENKHISELIARIEYELKKMDSADSFGLWDAAIYVLADDQNTALIGANSIRSLVIGDDSGKAESFINYWKNTSSLFNNGPVKRIIEFLHYGMHPVFSKSIADSSLHISTNSVYYFTPAIAVGGNSLPSLLGLPMKSVPGITVIETAEFGRNVVTDDRGTPGNRKMRLGEIVYMGKLDNTEVQLYVNSLSSHAFVCGAPGSGKSNTIYKLLYGFSRLEAKPERDDGYGNVHFLVIEPAKGEYKYEFGRMPNINIFTAQSNVCKLLRINPFEFPYEKMGVREHIDQLKDIISACWALTAAMPAILSDALESAYRYAGWDLTNSIYVLPGDVKFPSFRDVLTILPKIIKNTSYSAEAKGDYTGALVTRVSSLTKGMVGSIFTDAGTVSDSILFDENTIIDLSAIGSTEARALIMGVLVMKLGNYRKATATQSNYPLRHVTVLEEAHNLLPNCSTNQSEDSSNVQGKSVETISRAISEMRTYGEGFIIVDQSPSAVAKVAISNTSTKIVLRLPDEDDIKAVGSAMSLSEPQMKQIPMLPSGYAVVRQGNWLMAVQALVDKAPSTYFTRRLVSYDYDTLKAFRADVLEKCMQANMRNAKREKFTVADRDRIILFIDKKTDVAEHHRDYIKSKWIEFCSLDRKKRHKKVSTFVMDVISFYDGLLICNPRLQKLPEDINNPEKEYIESLKDWIDRMEDILSAYVTCDEEQMGDIIYHICCYCIDYPPSQIYHLCATSMLLMYNTGGA